jgi:chorismate lyase / 3-hydroxybenzoate synthase
LIDVTELHACSLRCAYLPLQTHKEADMRWNGRMLGMICFSSGSADIGLTATDLPVASVRMAALDSTGTACEVWCADGAVAYGMQNGIRYGHDDNILFGVIQLSEAQFDIQAGQLAGKTPLQQAAESAYRAIFQLADSLGFPHILRFWNYVADITGESHGMERYRQFNIGRQDGFLNSGRTVVGKSVPAASAVGSEDGPLTVCFIAGRGAPPVAIENPRQVSAYRYPQEYGPRSPTFSRASVAYPGDDPILFLSGTASIVGHRTLHAGDVVAQTRETLANIAAMVDEANRVAPEARFALESLCYKVYVRREKDLPAIETELRRALGYSARLLFLKADICRQDLLLEIEATAGHPLEFAISQGRIQIP